MLLLYSDRIGRNQADGYLCFEHPPIFLEYLGSVVVSFHGSLEVCIVGLTLFSLYDIHSDWWHINFSTDKGSDMVAEDHVYCYLIGVNENRDYDFGHGSHRGANKTLKDAGLWEHEVSMLIQFVLR